MGIPKTLYQFTRQQVRSVQSTFSTERPLIPLGSMTLDEDDVALAEALLREPDQWNDARSAGDFQERFARWNGSKYAFAFMGGRVSLSAALHALDLKPGDEIVLPAYTCVVVPNAVRFAGLRPVFADIELATFGLDVAQVEKRLTPRTRVILIHHMFGIVCRDYEDLLCLARRRGLRVIEDCAHATGAAYRGVKVGNRGDIGFYSTEQSKVFSTQVGGLVSTNDDSLARRIEYFYHEAPEPSRRWTESLLHKVIINFYKGKHRHIYPRAKIPAIWAGLLHDRWDVGSVSPEELRGIRPGHYGAKMPGALASIGKNQLRKVDAYNSLRRRGAEHWKCWAALSGYSSPTVIEGSTPGFLRYPILVEPEKKRSSGWAREQLGVELGVWFLSHIHPIPSYIDNCPNADVAVEKCINFPTILR